MYYKLKSLLVLIPSSKAKDYAMKTLEEIKKMLKSIKSTLKTDYNVVSLAIFGSYARNEQTENSDLDLLVVFDDNNYPRYSDFISLENYLAKITNLKIDLIPKENIKPFLKNIILNEALPI